jgi:hypothetical protein
MQAQSRSIHRCSFSAAGGASIVEPAFLFSPRRDEGMKVVSLLPEWYSILESSLIDKKRKLPKGE